LHGEFEQRRFAMTNKAQISQDELRALSNGPVSPKMKIFDFSKYSLVNTLLDIALVASVVLAYMIIASFATSGYVFNLPAPQMRLLMILAALAIHISLSVVLEESFIMPISRIVYFCNLLLAALAFVCSIWVMFPMLVAIGFAGLQPDLVVAFIFMALILTPLAKQM
jgi:hypothetical protein